jgi:glucokinase
MLDGVTFYQKESPAPMRHATMLEVNELLVLDYVREHDPTSRTQIVRDLGLSAASVSRIVGRLRRDGLVNESGTQRSDGGRPRTAISFRRDAGAVIAIDLGGTRCHSALADLAGSVLYEDIRPTHAEGDAFATLVAGIGAVRREAERRELPIVALAVGVPAILDPESGVARDAPYVGWHDFPVVRRLGEVVDIPFVVENDVNLAALAHAWRGAARRVDDFVTLSIGTGTGAAIVSGGRLIKGRHNAAGEVAYLVTGAAQPAGSADQGLGPYEAFVSGPGIAARAAELVRAGSGSALSDVEITPESVIDAARGGDQVARQVVEELLDQVSLAIIAFVAVVDPELVILDGGLGRALEPYVAALDARVDPKVPAAPRIVASQLGKDATVTGAVAAALELARRPSRVPLFGSFSLGAVALRGA